jgi:hypothetical protein
MNETKTAQAKANENIEKKSKKRRIEFGLLKAAA